MPAQWPKFVNNVSKKLESRSADTIDEFAIFLANEYFTAVKQSQTTFGNKHISGQKPILEKGFIAAFKEIYENETIKFEDKFEMNSFADFFEPLPNIDYDFDPLCEIEEWTKENQDTLTKFKFYSLFPSTCPVPKELDFYAGIDFNKMVEQNSSDANLAIQNSEDGILYVTLSISNFTEGVSFNFKYEVNGLTQPLLKADSEGILQLRASTDPGTHTYTFKEVLDLDGNLIKEINKSATVEINDSGEVADITELTDPSNGKTPRSIIPELTEEQIILALANRILYQNDGSELFKLWVDRLKLGYNSDFGKKVSKKLFEIVEPYYKSEEIKIKGILKAKNEAISKLRSTIPTINQLGLKNTLNEYIFQSEYDDLPERIPEWLTPKNYICKFTYIKAVDGIGKSNTVSKVSDENKRIISKDKLYKEEKKKWWDLLKKWGNSKNTNSAAETIINGDGYNIMAKAIIDYWKSTAVQPFKNSPPVPPCNVPPPLGGIYTPIYYGSESGLANDLRRAWNTGKSFGKLPSPPVASKAVASAVSVSCAKHLLQLKFLYLGGISTPVGPVPMVGFVPLVI
jgi:hypothetical protein